MPGARFAAWIVCGTLTAVSGAYAQSYPNKPIRIVTSAAGGSSDFMSRQIAQGIAGPLGQPVIVENRGSGIITSATVKQASPDGYTLLLSGGTFWMLPFLQDVSFDPIKDYSPITLTEASPLILVIHPAVPANSVKDLIALAKSKPGALNYAAAGAGAAPHLSAELFKSMAGADIVRVNYKGGGPAISALLGGEVQMMFATSTSVTAQIKAGKLKALAVTSAQPSALFPNLPAISATLPGYASTQSTGVFAPAKTPTAVITRLNQEIVRFLRNPEVKERFAVAGSEVIGTTPQELTVAMQADMARLGKLIKDLGIKAD